MASSSGSLSAAGQSVALVTTDTVATVEILGNYTGLQVAFQVNLGNGWSGVMGCNLSGLVGAGTNAFPDNNSLQQYQVPALPPGVNFRCVCVGISSGSATVTVQTASPSGSSATAATAADTAQADTTLDDIARLLRSTNQLLAQGFNTDYDPDEGD